jgi:hypothetical protein
MATVITADRPAEVASEVERLMKLGVHEFVLEPVARGGMLDQERLGAARYAAGRQAEVALLVAEAAQRR